MNQDQDVSQKGSEWKPPYVALEAVLAVHGVTVPFSPENNNVFLQAGITLNQLIEALPKITAQQIDDLNRIINSPDLTLCGTGYTILGKTKDEQIAVYRGCFVPIMVTSSTELRKELRDAHSIAFKEDKGGTCKYFEELLANLEELSPEK